MCTAMTAVISTEEWALYQGHYHLHIHALMAACITADIVFGKKKTFHYNIKCVFRR